MSIELKIKSKHLSEEARIIRFEEKKLQKRIRYNIDHYRSTGMNDEYPIWKDFDFFVISFTEQTPEVGRKKRNRATFLARAYIKGVPYSKIENKRKDEVLFRSQIFPRICSMVVKYGKREDGDWEWDHKNSKYNATFQLKTKISDWCQMK